MIGVCSFVGVFSGSGFVMGQADWASVWYFWIVLITSRAASSMSAGVICAEFERVSKYRLASSCAVFVASSPSWYRSMRGFGMGRMNGGWFLVVGIFVGVCTGGAPRSPICGMCARSALWSL